MTLNFPRGHLAAFLLLLVTCGCSGDPYRAISGKVTVDDQPLEKGVITLYPLGEGTTVGGEIVDGKFELAKESGPSPGNYRVEILAFKATGKTEFDIDEQKEIDIEVQYLPARYNTKSELTAEITPDGENSFEFPLESK